MGFFEVLCLLQPPILNRTANAAAKRMLFVFIFHLFLGSGVSGIPLSSCMSTGELMSKYDLLYTVSLASLSEFFSISASMASC